MSGEILHPLDEKYGKTYILRLLAIYNHLWKQKYGFNYTANIPLFGKAMKELTAMYTEIQVAALLVVFFNWAGLSGNDEFEQRRVASSGFAVFTFVKEVAKYEIYIRNVMNIKFDEVESVKKFLEESGLST